MIRILLVDDQKIIREALKIFLEPEADFQIIGTADNGMYAVEKVEELRPDIVLMNIEMPGLDGTSATQIITKKFTDTKVLILSSYDSDEYIAKSLSVGARGYLLKDTAAQDIVAAIRSVYKGYTQIGPGLLEKILIQTDSGIILNKLKSPAYQDNIPTLGTRKQPVQGSTNTATSSRQFTFEQQRTELNKLGNGLNKIAQELPEITRTLASYYKYIWRIWIFLLTSMPIISLILFSLYTKINNIEINSIPTERVGLYGESNLNGLAQRVVKAFEQDSELSNIFHVYVAQNGSTVVLTGRISNSDLLRRMENIARGVKGVTEVDTSQVKVIRETP
jgi:DNA-binding NarL/FixJ family response regulator